MTPQPKNIEQCMEWIAGARKMLGLGGSGRRMGQRNEEIHALLVEMDNIEKNRGKYPALKGNKEFAKFQKNKKEVKDKFEKLAIEANETKDQGEIKKIALELRALKNQARKTVGEVDPTSTPKVKNRLLVAVRKEPVYEDRLKQVNAAIEKLKKTPGATKQWEELESLVQKAAELVPPAYDEAVKLLPVPAAVKKILEKAEKSADDVPETLFEQPDFAKAYRNAEGLLKEYTTAAQYIDGDGIQGFAAELKRIVKEADDATDKTAAEVTATKAIMAVTRQLQLLLKGVAAERKRLNLHKSEVEKQWDAALKCATFSDTAYLKSMRERAQALESNGLLKEAATLYGELNEELEATIDLFASAPGDWENLQPTIENMEEVLKSASGKDELSSTVTKLRKVIVKAKEDATIRQEYAVASAAVERIEDEIETLKNAVAKWGVDGDKPRTVNFPDGRHTAEVKAQSLRTMVIALVDGVRKKEIAALEKEKGYSGELHKECDAILKNLGDRVPTILKNFADQYGSAVDPKDKQQVLDKFLFDVDEFYVQKYVPWAAEIGRKANRTVGDGKLLGKSQSKAERLKRRDEYLKFTEAARKALEQLAPFHLDRTEMAGYRKRLEKLQAGAEKDKDVQTEAGKLQKELEERKIAIEKETEERSNEAKLLADPLYKKIDKLAEKYSKYKTSFAELRTDVAIAANKLSSRVATINKKGKESFDDITKRIEELTKSLKDSDQNFKAVEEKIKVYKGRVAEVKKKDRRTHAPLDHEFEKVVLPEIGKMLPADALKRLETFRTEKLDPAEQKVVDLTLGLKEFKIAVNKLEFDMSYSPLFSTAPRLFAQLETRRKRAAAAAPSNLEFANNEIAAIRMLLKAAHTDSGKAEKLNQQAKEDEFEEERRKEEYLAAKELFKNNYAEGAKAAKSARPDEFRAMNKMVSQADKMADSTPPNFAGARENLERATEMAKFLIENLSDDTSPRGRDLEKMNSLWKNRVSAYMKQVAQLSSALSGASLPGGKKVDKKAVSKALNPLLGLFDPQAFDKYIPILAQTKPKLSLNDKRKHKEEVLLQIRRFQGRLKSNKTLAHVAGNPVANVSLKPLRDTLTGLSAEVLGF